MTTGAGYAPWRGHYRPKVCSGRSSASGQVAAVSTEDHRVPAPHRPDTRNHPAANVFRDELFREDVHRRTTLPLGTRRLPCRAPLHP